MPDVHTQTPITGNRIDTVLKELGRLRNVKYNRTARQKKRRANKRMADEVGKGEAEGGARRHRRKVQQVDPPDGFQVKRKVRKTGVRMGMEDRYFVTPSGMALKSKRELDAEEGVVYPAGTPVGSFPEALVVEVPEYCGPAFYPSEPKWVIILPKVSIKEGTRQTREQFPVVAGYALTVNKAQGLTLKEGVVINLTSGKRFKAASKHGLPFVAFTRSESFAMTAFKNLPPWEDFEKGQDSDMLRMRKRFTEMLHRKHTETMRKYSKFQNEEEENEAYEVWKGNCERDFKRRKVEPEQNRMPCPACAEHT